MSAGSAAGSAGQKQAFDRHGSNETSSGDTMPGSRSQEATVDDGLTLDQGADRFGTQSSEPVANSGFSVELSVYSGPFDVLLSMIAERKLELTEVSLSAITAEFIDYVRSLDMTHNMEEISAFLEVASVLIEAKSASLLPAGQDGERDEQSMEALRERDLLFARLVQYRAFKTAADDFRARFASNSGRFPHPAYTDETIAAMLPELAWSIGPADLAKIAAEVFLNAPADKVSLDQLHVAKVDLQQQSDVVRTRLRALKPGASMTFSKLAADASGPLEVVARFLAILLFFKQGALQYKQSGPFEELHLRWIEPDGDGQAESAIGQEDFA
jgi:segregation and condensation protein A